MSVRGQRLALFLPVVVTLLLAGLIGAVIIVQNQRNADLVTEADDVGNTFLADVSVFRTSVVKTVSGSRSADPAELRGIVQRALEDAPALGGASAYGAERSASYAEALRTQQTFLQPYRRLMRELRRSEVALEFIAQARSVLGLRSSTYIGSGLVDSSAPVRSRLIPVFAKARDDFAKVRVPAGQRKLAGTVLGAVQHVIDQANVLADSIEANRTFTFSYAEQYQVAIDAVEDYATVVEGDLAEAVNAVADGS